MLMSLRISEVLLEQFDTMFHLRFDTILSATNPHDHGFKGKQLDDAGWSTYHTGLTKGVQKNSYFLILLAIIGVRAGEMSVGYPGLPFFSTLHVTNFRYSRPQALRDFVPLFTFFGSSLSPG